MTDKTRIIKDRVFTSFVFFSGLTILAILFMGISLVAKKGLGAVSVDFLIEPMMGAGLSGGIIYHIAGTMILFATTLIIVTPLSFATALVKSFYIKNHLWQKTCTLFLYILNGIPSIIFGIFGFFFFVKFLGWGKSWLTGGILLAMMILPTASLSLAEGIKRIPREYIDNAKSLGLSKSSIVYSVLIPQSLSSFISGILLGLARAIGETAPIMFAATIFSGASIPDGIKENPVLSLPYHIFVLSQESYNPKALENAWGAAFVLIIMVFILSFAAMPFRVRMHEEAKGT